MSIEVSVVVATYKRDDLLRRCLEALASQDMANERYEVVVVDDARGTTAAGVVAGVAARHQGLTMKCVEGRSRGPATARNIGIGASMAPVIAFTDDDAYPASNEWLSHGLAHFALPDVNAVGGRVIVPADDPPTDFQRNVKALERGEFLTCNAFYRRTALQAVGGFDERFTVPFREDSDLQYRVEALGGRMVHDSGLVVVHPAPAGRFATSLRLQRYSLFNALMYKKHPDHYRRRLQSSPPFHYYAIVLLALTALVALALGEPLIALAATGGWLALEGWFLHKRFAGVSHSPRHVLDLAITSVLIPPLSIYWRLRGALRYHVLFI
jgi:glycosyltransferase involved in cell wall biosynthesis